MATRRIRNRNKTSYITYDELEALGFGSWLKKNAGIIGSVAGAAIGSVLLPGVGTALGAQIGGSLGGAVSANEADKEQTAAQNKMIAQQNAKAAAEAQLKMEMNSAPKITTTPVLAYGGNPDNSSSSNNSPTEPSDKVVVGYKVLSGKTEVPISLEEINDVNKFLDMKKHVDEYFYRRFATRNKKINEIMAKEGLTYDEVVTKYKDIALPAIDVRIPLATYPSVKNKEMTVDDAYVFFQKQKDRFTPDVSSIIGTIESRNKTLPSEVDYGRRSAEVQYKVIPIYKNIDPPIKPEDPETKPKEPVYVGRPLKNLSFTKAPDAPHIFYVYDKNDGLIGFTNQMGAFIPIDPKLGADVTRYKNATGSWQRMGEDLLKEEDYTRSQDKTYPYFVTRNQGRVIVVDPPIPSASKSNAYATGGKVSPGTINYTGQTHEGPDGGIPIDAVGNPVARNDKEPIALVEKGEVAYSSPDIGTYVFSNRLKYKDGKTFADKARDIQRKYKLRMKDGKITDPIAEVGYRKEMEALIEQQEAFREVSGVNKEERIKEHFASMGMPIENNVLPIGANGIYIKPSKRGTFVAAAKKHGMSPQEFARHVLANKKDFSSDVVDEASLVSDSAELDKKGNGSFAKDSPIQSTIGVGTVLIPALASTIGNAWLLGKMKKRDKNAVKLDYTPIGYQEVDLSKERNAATENALTMDANLKRSALMTGASAGQILQNNINSTLGVQRELGQSLSKSYSTEALENARIRSETDRFNAAQKLEADKYNMDYQMNRNAQYDAIRASIANAWAKAASDYLTGMREAKALNMSTNNYQLQYSGDKRWKNLLFGNFKIGTKP